MRGCVVKNADGSQFLGQRVVSIIKFFQFQDIVSSDDHQQFLVWDAQHLVRSQQPSAPLALRLTVLGDDLRYGNGLAHGHGGVDLHRHITAPRGEVLGADLIGTAQHELHVQVADDLRPEIVGIPVLELTEALHGQHHIDRTAADNAERTGEIRTVRCAAELAHIVELIEDEVDRDFAAQLRRAVGIAHQLDE